MKLKIVWLKKIKSLLNEVYAKESGLTEEDLIDILTEIIEVCTKYIDTLKNRK